MRLPRELVAGSLIAVLAGCPPATPPTDTPPPSSPTGDTAAPPFEWVGSPIEVCDLPAWCPDGVCHIAPGAIGFGAPVFVHPDGDLRLVTPGTGPADEEADPVWLRWDGSEFSADPAIPPAFVPAFVAGEDVWGSVDGALVRSVSGGSYAPVTDIPDLPPGPFSFVFGSGPQNLWLATTYSSGMGITTTWAHYDGTTWLLPTSSTFGVPGEAVADGSGRIWLVEERTGFIGHLLRHWNGTEWTTVDLDGPAPLGVAKAPDGTIWLGTSDGLFREESGVFTLVAEEAVGDVAVTTDGAVWSGTAQGGLGRWLDGAWQPLPGNDTASPGAGGLVAIGEEVWTTGEGVARATESGACGLTGTPHSVLARARPSLAFASDETLHLASRSGNTWSGVQLAPEVEDVWLVPNQEPPLAVVRRSDDQGTPHSALLQEEGSDWVEVASLPGLAVSGATSHEGVAWLRADTSYGSPATHLFRFDEGTLELAHQFAQHEAIRHHVVTAEGTHWVLRDAPFSTYLSHSTNGTDWTTLEPLPWQSHVLAGHGETLWLAGYTIVAFGDGMTFTTVCGDVGSQQPAVVPDATGAWVGSYFGELYRVEGEDVFQALTPRFTRPLAIDASGMLWRIDETGLSAGPQPQLGEQVCTAEP